MNWKSNRILPAALYQTLLLGALLQVEPSLAQPRETLYPLYFADLEGDREATIALSVDYHAYGLDVSSEAYPGPLDRQSPEGVLAEMIRLVQGGELRGFRNLYLPEQQELVAQENLAFFGQLFEDVTRVVYRDRYRVGKTVIISYQLIFAPGTETQFGIDHWGALLRKTQEGYYLEQMSLSDPVLALAGLHMFNKENGFSARLAGEYEYSVGIPTSDDEAQSSPNMNLHFNGWAGSTLVDETMAVRDEVDAFLRRIVLAYRIGSDEEWLSLWSGTEREERFELIFTPRAEPLYESERRRFEGEVRVVFKMELGPAAAVFVDKTNPDCSGLDLLTFYRDSEAERFFLTEQNDEASGEQSGERFSDNLRLIFSSSFFREFVAGTVAPFQSALSVFPREIVLREGDGPRIVRIGVCGSGTREFRIGGVRLPDPSISADVERSGPYGYRILLGGLVAEGALQGQEVRIVTDVDAMGEIVIPIRVIDGQARAGGD